QGPRLRRRKLDGVSLLAVAGGIELQPFGLDQLVENRGAHVELLGGALALLLVLDRRELGEPGDLRVGRARLLRFTSRFTLRFLGRPRRRIVRRTRDQRLELLAGMAKREPVGNVAALRNIRPMRLEVEPADALGDAKR